MAKAPKIKKTAKVTNATRLETLKKHGFVAKSVKTFNQTVRKTWSDFNDAFPRGRLFQNSTLLKGSKDVLNAAKSVNMLVIGDRIVYPAANTKVKIRETKDKVIFYQTKPSGHRDIIVLGKDGNHLKAGLEYAKKFKNRDGKLHTFGTLKTHVLKTSKGVMHKGFMRDLAQTYPNPIDAMLDHRYLVDTGGIDPADYFDDEDGFFDTIQESNGVAALILTEY